MARGYNMHSIPHSFLHQEKKRLCLLFPLFPPLFWYHCGMDTATTYYHKVCELEKKLNQVCGEISTLKKEKTTLTKRVMELEIENAQLKDMIFGNGGKGGTPGGFPFPKLHTETPPSKPRNAQSYRRALPPEEAVTETKSYTLSECHDCYAPLRFLQTLIRYIEDIPFPVKKTVTKEIISVYYCSGCEQKKYGKETNLHGSQVTLGSNIKQFILYGIYLQHLTFQKVRDFFHDCYGLEISDGEIQHILRESAEKLEKQSLAIRKQIRAGPIVHIDETGWRLKKERYYLWGMMSGTGPEVSLEIRDTRGKGVAEMMIGTTFKGTLISDFYGAYKRLVDHHGVCWVHLMRDFYDIARNSSVPKRYRKQTKRYYEGIVQIYHELKDILKTPFNLRERQGMEKVFQKKLQQFAESIAPNIPLNKIQCLKKRIRDYEKELLICITKEFVPPHNNHAEQSLRHSVIKRKISFGSHSKEACTIFSINMSVLQTLWRTSKKSFFTSLAAALG